MQETISLAKRAEKSVCAGVYVEEEVDVVVVAKSLQLRNTDAKLHQQRVQASYTAPATVRWPR